MPLVLVLTFNLVEMNLSRINCKIMNRRFLIFQKIVIAIICVFNFSCKKYLDIKRNSSQSLIETVSDCQLLLNDYANMNVGYPSDGEASADNYYINNTSYLAPTTNTEEQDLYTWQSGAIRAAALPQWQYPYKVVYLSNLVLEALDKLKGNTDQATYNDLRGQALFFRAYSFWQLTQLYTKPYAKTSAGQDLGIPLRLKSDINGKSDRGNLEQSYTQIISDLSEAVASLSSNFVVASRPNKTAAYAMLARVYLSMGDYSNALNNANLALQSNSQLIDYNTLDVNSNTPFSRFNKEVIFHTLMTPGVTLNPGSATSNVAKIDSVLINSYDANDLRKVLFFKANSASNARSFRFTGNYEPVTNAALFNGLTVDELYLTRSECYARSGNIAGAMEDLNALLKTRWKGGTYINIQVNSSDEALNKVLSERRKELVMRGLRWTDLRRLNLDSRFSVLLTRNINGNSYTLPANDPRYTLLIPNEVIINSSIVQNAR